MTEMREALESFDAAAPERIGSPSLGDVVRQGDLYLIAIESLPNGKKTKERQLVPGTTQGSRHVVEGDVEIVNEVHPEHGDKILPADTVWQCVYQQAYADEIRRVQD
jgi:hypothetical protein